VRRGAELVELTVQALGSNRVQRWQRARLQCVLRDFKLGFGDGLSKRSSVPEA
jgi:hypothetical protein